MTNNRNRRRIVDKADVRAALAQKFVDPLMVDIAMGIYDVLEDADASPSEAIVALTLSLGASLQTAPSAVRYAVAAVVLGGFEDIGIFRRLCQHCNIAVRPDSVDDAK